MSFSVYSFFVLGYLGVMIALALYFLTRVKSQADFAVAGKSLPTYVVAGTLLATSMGGGAVVGGTNSIAYKSGPLSAIIFGLGVPVGAVILYFLRQKIRASNAQSIPELLESRFGAGARLTSSIIITLAFIAIVSYQYKSFAFVLEQALGINNDAGLLIALGLILLTALLGGLYSVAYTDFISVCLMLVGIVIGIPWAFIATDGFSVMQANLPAEHLALGGNSWLALATPFFPLLLVVLSDQNNFQRFAAAKGQSELKIGTICWILGLLILSPLIALGSSLSHALNGDIPAGQSLIMLATTAMPSIIGGFALAAITGFVLTTGNSFLLSGSVNLTDDVIERFFLPNLAEKQKLILNRSIMLLLAVLAYVMIAYYPSILAIQLYAYTMYGAAITPVFLAALLCKRVNGSAVIASMLVAAAATIAWEILLKRKDVELASVWVAFPASVVTLVLVAWFCSLSKPQRT